MMWDPASIGVSAVARQSPYAFPFLFAAGALTSIGPCSAPRMIAAAGLTSTAQRSRLQRIAAFVSGILLVYIVFALFGAVFTSALKYSSWVYAITGLALLISGFVGLLHLRAKDSCSAKHTAIPSGAVVFLGASTALVISPCCTPILASVVALAAATGNALFAALSVVAFGVGHAMPAVAVGSFGGIAKAFEKSEKFQDALSTIGSALMMGLGAYYLVLV